MNVLLSRSDISETVRTALAEDIGSGDLTAQLIATHEWSTCRLISRESAVICGFAWFEEVYNQLNSEIQITWSIQEGQIVTPQQELCRIKGPTRTLLTGERTAINFLQTLSSTATQVRRYVEAVAGTKAVILDTRKTIPGLRGAQKCAVRCGGGTNHRMGLYDAFLIKENHIIAAGSIHQAVKAARQLAPHLPVEVEVETLEQIEESLQVGVERLLLDNFDLLMLRQAVGQVQGRARLEASGGVTLETVRAIAETGVDFISVGVITKDIKAIDLSMRMLPLSSS
ncbi:MAG: nicotinate-nucleotide diphosphorylase (carboxylating) [Beggiatoa sp. IS2]|nr:MAG: nicotinate-nucleotide diphosphorylase (carboxylating) [Beggiatoa sp. IS2]